MLKGKAYAEYLIEDFLGDSSFTDWVKKKTDSNHWKNVFAENPHLIPLAEEAEKWILQLNFIADKASLAETVRFNEKLNQSIQTYESKGKLRRLHQQTMRIAAIFAVIMAIGGIAFWSKKYFDYNRITTGYGKTLRIELPDHSEVILNANSTIKYLKNWNTDNIREVWVEGEAFFNVKHLNKNEKSILNSERFVVHTPDLDVQVLGTSFNVNNRRNLTKVVLETGKVSIDIKEKKEKIYLTPGTSLEYNPTENVLVKKVIKAADESAWKQSKLVFNGVSLAEVAKTIEDNYGYKVTIEGEELKERKLSGTLSIKSEDILFAALQSILKVEIIKDKNDRTLIIKAK